MAPSIRARLALIALAVVAMAPLGWMGLRLPAGVSPATAARVRATWATLPLSFEANLGQTHPDVQFLSRGHGYALFLTATEAVLVVRKPEGRAVARMQLVGARGRADARGLQELPGRSSYFVGKDPQQWRSGIPTYARVEYADVYPGIDLVYYGTQQRSLEYDFVVAPGADPAAITLSFQGAERVELEAGGDLALHGPAGLIRIHKPVAYQESNGVRTEVAAGYRMTENGQVGFQVAAYDTSAPLVIDPVVNVWTALLSGDSADQGWGIAVDSGGNSFVTGNTISTTFPVTTGAFQSAGAGGTDAFVAKISEGGTLLYSTFLGGGRDDAGRGIAADEAGNAYITGFTDSTDFPTTANAFQTTHGTETCRQTAALNCDLTDAFVAKLDRNGAVLVYSTFLGGAGVDVGLGIAVDQFGTAYVTGGTRQTFPAAAPPFPVTLGTFQTAPGGGTCGPVVEPVACRDAFVTALNSTGGVVYSTLVGGGADDAGNGIAVDFAGRATLTGFTASANFPTTPGAFQTALLGTTDAFITQLNVGGTFLTYSTYLGGSDVDTGNGIALQGSFASVTGTTSSLDFPIVDAAFAFSTVPGAFALQLPLVAGMGPVYSRSLMDLDVGAAITVDVNGNAYIAGTETRCTLVGPGPCVVNLDAFVTKLDPTGGSLYQVFVGGGGDDTGQGIGVDPLGNAYLTGETASADFPLVAPPDVVQLVDAFVHKLTEVEDGGGGGGGCFIATAAFGSPLAREVATLREFRDRRLLTNAPGRLLVRAYYRISPPLARAIASSEPLRAAARGALQPVVWAAHASLARPTSILALGAGCLAVALLGAWRWRSRRSSVFIACAVLGVVAVTVVILAGRDSGVARRSDPPRDAPGSATRPLRISGREADHGRLRVRELNPGYFEIRGMDGTLRDLSLTARPNIGRDGGLQISSVVADGVLTERGLTVTNLKLPVVPGIEVGDTITRINGLPVRQLPAAALAMRRDPDLRTVSVEIDRGGTRLVLVYRLR